MKRFRYLLDSLQDEFPQENRKDIADWLYTGWYFLHEECGKDTTLLAFTEKVVNVVRKGIFAWKLHEFVLFTAFILCTRRGREVVP